MNIRSFKLHLLIVTAFLLQLGVTRAIAEDKGIIDWEALNPDIKGATFVKSSTECVECHEEYIRTYAMTRMGRALPDGGCESCHGPMSKHLDAPRQKPALVVSQKNLEPEQGSAICTQCHQSGLQLNWQMSPHAAADNTCTNCHDIMSVEDPVRVRTSQTKVCFTCHTDKRAQMRRFSRHPIKEGKVVCSDCHNPHGGPGRNLAKNTVNETCYQCHAEKRGPFLVEHQPVRESCTICHDPHGSTQPRMLVQRSPFLCHNCHARAATGHVGVLRDGSLLPPSTSANNRFILAKSCLNCHSQIHGSNHPSGVFLTR